MYFSTEDFHIRKKLYKNLGTKFVTLLPVFHFVKNPACLTVGHLQNLLEHALSYIEREPIGPEI